jgi:ubiquinone/menaquinone biosynthesis C-methylase UbiE
MEAAYDSIAEWYATRVQADTTAAGSWAFPTLLDLAGDIRSSRVCDLGCGEGRIARLLAQHCAHVMGIDLSPELIAVAWHEEAAHPLGINYRIDDAQTLCAIPDAAFDGVVCGLALMDIPELDATFRTVWRIIRPDGWFIFLITHPCFAAPEARLRVQSDGAMCWEIPTYFTEGMWRSERAESLIGRVGAHHRTLSTYLNTLVSTGFTITHVVEPQAPSLVCKRNPAHSLVPLLLLVRSAKTSPGSTG